MSKTAENTLYDAIRNAETTLAKAKEAQCLALYYFNCDDYDHGEAITDIMMNGYSPTTNNGRMIANIIADAPRLQRYIDMGFDYIHKAITDLQAAIIEAKNDNQEASLS
jgi:hypothetical protein